MSSKRVLIVDDNVDGVNSIVLLLRLSGHDIHVAHDGREAIAKARRVRPDVLFLDIGLPGLDGFQVARILRGESGMESMRIIAVTGYASENDRRQAAEAGFDQYVVKPADPHFLESLLGPHRV